MTLDLDGLPPLAEPFWDLALLVRARAAELGDAPYLSFGLDERTLTFAEADHGSDAVTVRGVPLGLSMRMAVSIAYTSARNVSVWRTRSPSISPVSVTSAFGRSRVSSTSPPTISIGNGSAWPGGPTTRPPGPRSPTTTIGFSPR